MISEFEKFLGICLPSLDYSTPYILQKTLEICRPAWHWRCVPGQLDFPFRDPKLDTGLLPSGKLTEPWKITISNGKSM